MAAPEEDTSYSKLPIEERCVHKVIFQFHLYYILIYLYYIFGV